MGNSETKELFWFIHDLANEKLIPQTDLTDGSDYSKGWVDACNIIMKHLSRKMIEKK